MFRSNFLIDSNNFKIEQVLDESIINLSNITKIKA